MRTESPKKRRLTVLATALILAAGGSIAIALPDKVSSPIKENTPIQQVEYGPRSFASLVERVKPAVVNISTKGGHDRQASTGHDFGMPNFPDASPFSDELREFFGQMLKRPEGTAPQLDLRAAGSGFIVSPEGHVVTSDHVVEHADEITVVLDDGRRFPAQLQGRDPETDLALLKIDAGEALPFVELADTDDTKVGEWVVAVGNPFGLGGTVTAGILSARGRDIQSGPYHDYLQIDAPINRGNSGGPLFDTDGKVIGINTAIYSPTGGSVGIGFAVPASTAKDVIAELKTSGRIERAWLGVQIQPITAELAKGLDLPDRKGALVASVEPGSPADKAGIQAGDVIYEINREPVAAFKDLPRLVATSPVGAETQFRVWREGKRVAVTATLEPLSRETPELATANDELPTDAARLGVYLAELTAENRARYSIPDERTGVLVVDVEPDSPAAKAGIRSGDVIMMVDQSTVSAPEDVASRVVEAAAEQRPVVLLMAQDESKRFIAVEPTVG